MARIQHQSFQKRLTIKFLNDYLISIEKLCGRQYYQYCIRFVIFNNIYNMLI